MIKWLKELTSKRLYNPGALAQSILSDHVGYQKVEKLQCCLLNQFFSGWLQKYAAEYFTEYWTKFVKGIIVFPKISEIATSLHCSELIFQVFSLENSSPMKFQKSLRTRELYCIFSYKTSLPMHGKHKILKNCDVAFWNWFFSWFLSCIFAKNKAAQKLLNRWFYK